MSENSNTKVLTSINQLSKSSDNDFSNAIVKLGDHKLTYWSIFWKFHLHFIETTNMKEICSC